MAAASTRCLAVLVATLSVALLLTASRVEANSGAVGRRALLMEIAPEMNDTAGNLTAGNATVRCVLQLFSSSATTLSLTLSLSLVFPGT